MKEEKAEKTDVRSVYKKYRISSERRKFTGSLLTTLQRLSLRKIEEGEVYCLKYVSHESLTDKWHTLSVVYVTEVNGQHVKGINLLYLNPSITLNILTEAEKVKKDLKNSVFYKQLLEEFDSQPLACVTKTFSTHRILSAFQLRREDWGMVPIIEKGMFGNLNVIALQEDWKREEEQIPEVKKKKKKKKALKKAYTEEVIEVEEDFDPEEVFDKFAGVTASIHSLKDEIMGDDDI